MGLFALALCMCIILTTIESSCIKLIGHARCLQHIELHIATKL